MIISQVIQLLVQTHNEEWFDYSDPIWTLNFIITVMLLSVSFLNMKQLSYLSRIAMLVTIFVFIYVFLEIAVTVILTSR